MPWTSGSTPGFKVPLIYLRGLITGLIGEQPKEVDKFRSVAGGLIGELWHLRHEQNEAYSVLN